MASMVIIMGLIMVGVAGASSTFSIPHGSSMQLIINTSNSITTITTNNGLYSHQYTGNGTLTLNFTSPSIPSVSNTIQLVTCNQSISRSVNNFTLNVTAPPCLDINITSDFSSSSSSPVFNYTNDSFGNRISFYAKAYQVNRVINLTAPGTYTNGFLNLTVNPNYKINIHRQLNIGESANSTIYNYSFTTQPANQVNRTFLQNYFGYIANNDCGVLFSVNTTNSITNTISSVSLCSRFKNETYPDILAMAASTDFRTGNYSQGIGQGFLNLYASANSTALSEAATIKMLNAQHDNDTKTIADLRNTKSTQQAEFVVGFAILIGIYAASKLFRMWNRKDAEKDIRNKGGV